MASKSLIVNVSTTFYLNHEKILCSNVHSHVQTIHPPVTSIKIICIISRDQALTAYVSSLKLPERLNHTLTLQ